MNSFIYNYRVISQFYSIHSLYHIIQVQTTFVGTEPTKKRTYIYAVCTKQTFCQPTPFARLHLLGIS